LIDIITLYLLREGLGTVKLCNKSLVSQDVTRNTSRMYTSEFFYVSVYYHTRRLTENTCSVTSISLELG